MLLLGSGFRGDSAISGRGPGCVCLGSGFGLAPSFLAGVFGACVWVCIFPAPCYFWLGCWGPCPLARSPSVSRHPLVELVVAWGCVSVTVGRVSPFPPLFCFGLPGCGGGGSVGVILGLVVLWLFGGRRRLSWSWATWSPPPLLLLCGFRLLFSMWPVARHFSGGLCRSVSGVPFAPALRRPCGRGRPLLWLGVA